MIKGARLSDDHKYRYSLWRIWDESKAKLYWIMLNPSTANAEQDDATIRVCMGRARHMDYGGIVVYNLFNYRTVDPEILKLAADPVGPQAEGHLGLLAAEYDADNDMVIAAWGIHGTISDLNGEPRWRVVVRSICTEEGIPLYRLRLTQNGMPCHPLRVPYSVEPTLWADPDEEDMTLNSKED